MRRAPPMSAQLQVVYPPELVTCRALGPSSLLIGRQPGPDGLALPHGTVSRRHAELRWDGRQHHLVELGSSNGTRLGGEQLAVGQGRPLDDNAIVRLGDVLAVYECGKAVGASAPADVSVHAVPGVSARTVALRAAIAAAAADPSPVLLSGETGTGKEFIGREIHRLSRRSGPLLAINCGALSPQLIESQLFGHEKGAFTGAQGEAEGLFRAAHGGTLMLDEVGELPLDMQVKLLRVLQEHEVLPVGATRPIPVDVRVVSATLRDLRAATDAGTFRLDLYARLSPWEIAVPPLRARRADLLQWIERLHHQWHERRGQAAKPPQFEVNATERLLLHPWPDNLRGLDRLVHQAHATEGPYDLAEEVELSAARLDQGLVAGEPVSSRPLTAPARAAGGSGRKRRPRPSREELEAALNAHEGSVRAAAKALGRDRRQVYRWMEQYGLRTHGEPDG